MSGTGWGGRFEDLVDTWPAVGVMNEDAIAKLADVLLVDPIEVVRAHQDTQGFAGTQESHAT